MELFTKWKINYFVFIRHTWIFDIDGTICKRLIYKIDGFDTLLPGVKEFFANIPQEDLVIFITSRDESIKDMTESFLTKNEIRFDNIIYNAPYGERILVNDNKPSGLKTAFAICIERNGTISHRVIIDNDR